MDTHPKPRKMRFGDDIMKTFDGNYLVANAISNIYFWSVVGVDELGFSVLRHRMLNGTRSLQLAVPQRQGKSVHGRLVVKLRLVLEPRPILQESSSFFLG